MEYLIYIGAALVIGLLIGFVALSVLWLREAMVRNVRSHTLNLISVMDDILEEKSRELANKAEEVQNLEEELVQLEEEGTNLFHFAGEQQGEPTTQGVSPATFMAAIERASTDSYRDSAVGDAYRQIRQNFSFHVEQLLPTVAAQSYHAGGPAGHLLMELEFDTVYHLSTLDTPDQIAVLRECLPQEGLGLLEGYLHSHSQFNVFEFYDYLKYTAASEPKTARLYVPSGTPTGTRSRAAVEVTEDADICEGFQLELGGKLYDYCIKTKELG